MIKKIFTSTSIELTKESRSAPGTFERAESAKDDIKTLLSFFKDATNKEATLSLSTIKEI